MLNKNAIICKNFIWNKGYQIFHAHLALCKTGFDLTGVYKYRRTERVHQTATHLQTYGQTTIC